MLYNKAVVTAWLMLSLLLCSLVAVSAPISPEALSKNFQYDEVKLSPDGKKMAIALVSEGERKLVVVDTSTFKPIGGASLGNGAEVGDFIWANEERLVIEVWRRSAWEESSSFYGELYSVNYDGSQGEMIYGFANDSDNRTGSRLKRKESVRGWAHIINRLPDEPRKILITSTPMSDAADKRASIHKLDIYRGFLGREIADAPGPQSKILTDYKGNILIGTATNKNGDNLVYRYLGDADREWEEISDDFGESFTPITMNFEGTGLLYLDAKGQDKLGLFSLDMSTGKKTSIYTDENVSITDLNLTVDRSSAYAIRVDDGYPTYALFNNKGDEAKVFKSLLSTLPGYKLTLTSSTEDGKLWILYASNDIDAGTFYLFDSETNQLQQLFANMSHISIDNFAESRPITFQASDGLKISGYLTYPLGMKKDQKVPLVTLVHGGPHGVRDYWSFDREVHLLASQGYAVLRVNYRGSAGYGLEYADAGKLHWGDTVQQDIIEGTKWVIAQGNVNADRVCIMGTSFGAYSAVMSSIVAPDLFKCAVANAGIYDLEMLYEEGDIRKFLSGGSYLEGAVGKDRAQLRAFSPVDHAEKLQAPVFIAHGERDERAPIEHAEALKAALEKAGKPYEWHIKRGEAHGFANEDNRKEYYEKLLKFIDKHI